MTRTQSQTTVDARGLKCPLPVLKAEKALALAPAGATIRVLATDPLARIDIPLYCSQRGYPVTISGESEMEFEIVKRG